MSRKASKKPLRAGAIGGKRQAPLPAAVQMHPSDSGILKRPSGTLPTPVAMSDPSRFTAFANPSLKQNLGPWFYPGPSLYNYGFDENGLGNISEEQLEEIVINYLDCIYKEVISRLVFFGYDAALALRAVLCNGHCYGAVDALSNIMQNALGYLNTVAANTADDWNDPAGAFSDLRHLEEYSLAVMVCLLQQIRADLSRGEAMWCLLMSGLRVRLASSIKFPSCPGNLKAASTAGAFTPGAALPFAMQGRRRQQEVEEEEKDLVQLVLKRLEAMRIEDEKHQDKEVQDQKKEMIMDLVNQIRELEGQVKERKEWAQQKAIQAARKLSSDLHELRVLRLEREENQRAVKGKQVLEDSTMKRLAEMENALKKTSGQVDRANAAVKKLETENAEIRAEMEASKLSASESVTACMEVTKREKKCLKKLVAWEKQKEKVQEEIAEKRKKIVLVQQQLAEVQEATKQTEIKWRQEMKDKEEALSLLEEEHRAKEAAEANCKRRQEGLRQKIEIDFQRYKDDIHRLEEELSRRREVAAAARLIHSVDTDAPKPLAESNPKILLPEPRHSPQNNKHRICWVCRDNEVSVVFLPCAHQVLCYSCNEGGREKGSHTCPACKEHIEDRIRVYGASS
ncbi:hypothetical protein M5K25_001733 [Dendrobium thyrsiflorum]|uniref:RING-type domain-containing protein n=1 Tax=Dendrobium thyrsiflorum TaxID=117978 RepID=A0ABD0W3S4_DENTH